MLVSYGSTGKALSSIVYTMLNRSCVMVHTTSYMLRIFWNASSHWVASKTAAPTGNQKDWPLKWKSRLPLTPLSTSREFTLRVMVR